MTKQTVWRTMTETSHSGCFIWEVLEVVGEPYQDMLSHYTKTRDGSYVLEMCYHFFSQASAEETLRNCYDDQELIVIPRTTV